MAETIFYLGVVAGDSIHERTFAGVRRYAALRGWDAKCVGKTATIGSDLREVLAANLPVAGCIVEGSDDTAMVAPRRFGRSPVVHLHASPALRRSGSVCIGADNEAVARGAFMELSAGHPDAFAVVGVREGFSWSRVRTREFKRLATEAKVPCHVFPIQPETRQERLDRLTEWVRALPPKTAVFAVNDFTAAYVTAAARAAARSIPRDLTLIGVDDNAAVCETSRPTISSIRLDHERAGFLAARILGEQADACGARDSRAPGEPRQLPAVGPLMAVWRRSTSGRGRREPFVLDAVDMIRREACEGLTCEALAARFPVSQRLFNLRFREAVGHSVLDEIQHVRLEAVFALLSRTDTAIGAIAGMCGFRTDIALKWIFRKKTGMSMSEWRRRNRR